MLFVGFIVFLFYFKNLRHSSNNNNHVKKYDRLNQ